MTQTDPAIAPDDTATTPMSGGPGSWSMAWRTVAVITLFEITLAAGLRWSLPRLVPSSPALQMGIGYVVFMALGEIWGQCLHWTGSGNRFSTREVRRFLRAADWVSVLGMIALTALFFSWFWPWTFRLWGQHLPRPWFGAADQLFTGPLSLAPIFLLHGWLEASRAEARLTGGFRGRLLSKLSGLIHTLRVALPYWGIGLGVIFSLPFDFVFQNLLTGAIQTPFTTFLFFMANRPHDPSVVWRMRPWAKWTLPLIVMHNLMAFPIWCDGVTLVTGVCAYAVWLWWGVAPVTSGSSGPPRNAVRVL